MNPSLTTLNIESWSGPRRTRVVTARVTQTLEAWTVRDAIRALKRIEADRCLIREGGAWGEGWIGFVSYDFGHALLFGRMRRRKLALPLLRFHRVSAVGKSVNGVNRTAQPRCKLIRRSDTRSSYLRKIRAVQEELRAGNAYEVNLSQRWEWRFDRAPDASRLFSTMSRAMRPRYGVLEETNGHAILCFSPELFFSVRGRAITAEPIKGTAGPRDRTLLRSAKDRAELLMITDLFRNDLGKVCVPGSIRARGPIETRLPYARHLYSRVRGRLRADTRLVDLFRAMFPSGSVTGAPKIAACGIIDRLEPFAREEAFGAVGWVGRDRMEFAVSIRTAFLSGRRLRYTAGGGITVYSDPEKEYEETLLKAGSFIGCLSV